MNKVFCNKETHIVEQIICIDIDKRFDESWYPNCYIVDDEDNEIQTYNLRYNQELEKFEVVEGMEETPEVKFEKSEIEFLREDLNRLQATTMEMEKKDLEIENLIYENKQLKDRLRIIEEKLGL